MTGSRFGGHASNLAVAIGISGLTFGAIHGSLPTWLVIVVAAWTVVGLVALDGFHQLQLDREIAALRLEAAQSRPPIKIPVNEPAKALRCGECRGPALGVDTTTGTLRISHFTSCSLYRPRHRIDPNPDPTPKRGRRYAD